ncbi:hypothetical protein HYPSUDRAFT_684903 [Hypholoma sublateritium FD-334 SS-4]|uniref:RING-type domain-containing protein n=1 Tax=Hypholoma sublateritium (strain FD-334 SS-4) TaxID=945553 RepID=A0A0D2NS27_HYPSF|nr:hypothetical protein HYPSUDRAFT_684903 [Hypholoma sublateritium FD-334 SS-4]
MIASSSTNPEPSSSRTHLGAGRALCVICGIRPHYDDGRRAFPTCGNTCKRQLEAMTGSPTSPLAENSQSVNRPLCVICKTRPQFNNGRRAFPTCGNTCARALQDLGIPHGSSMSDFNGTGPVIKMCYVCNVRPRYQRGGKAYPTCGLTCATKLHLQDRKAASSIQTNPRERSDEEVSTASYPKEDVTQLEELPETVEINEDTGTYTSGKSKGRATENGKTFNCIICLETLNVDHIVRFACRHPFCRSCLQEHITSELRDHHYPIICPLCKIEDKTTHPSMVDDKMLRILGLGESELDLFYELQLAAHSIAIHCQRCKETMFVDRRDYQETNIIECPLPRCNYIWCKHCHAGVKPKGPRHSCDGTSELEHLMKKNGWRHCPGCQTPVQKSDGCNHMTCSSPGCNTHFCYKCGVNIVKSLLSADIRAATQAHYQTCQLY